ncbi:MAG TPA: trehalose-6-phosphate synthase [Longimicrobiales bacterium]|nr:trehalose-6-phosphate synthase [Longimicrobiales bacterium]
MEQTDRRGPDRIVAAFRAAFPDQRLLVVSNREPYEHRWGEDVGEIRVKRPAGGLTSALDPLMQAVGGVWIAWGSGDADAAVVDEEDRVRVPPGDPSYTVRRLWLDQHDVNRYYLGFSNQFLWPLCHYRPALTRMRARYWERYRRVNRRFADAVLDEAREGPAVVWFQDYHLAVAPAMVRKRRPDLTLAHFWHIPWPPLEIFEVTPQARELLTGLLANDLMGFQLPSHRSHFLRCAEAIVGAEVDWSAGTATLDGHTCHVRSFPISIDVEAFQAAAGGPGTDEAVARLRERYCPPGGQLGIGVDRMDYSKGLPEKLKALDFLWERYPEYRERFSFIQVGVPSRTDIEAYDDLTRKVERFVRDINRRYGTDDWEPIHLIKQSLPSERLAVLYRAADLCIVSSLRDGMNLVAKEFVASQVDHRGVLLLSRFAGAFEELGEAMEVNPYDPEDFGRLVRDALNMPGEERAERLERMQGSMRTIYEWMVDIFETWGALADEGAGAGTSDTPTGGPDNDQDAPTPQEAGAGS